MHDLEPGIFGLQKATNGHSIRVPVEGQQPAGRAELFENGARMSAASESAIHIEAVGPNGQKLQHLVLEDRHM